MNRFFHTTAAVRTPRAAATTLGIILCGSSVAMAQSTQSASGSESQWSLGLGVAGVQKVYRDIDRDSTPLPILNFENKWVSVGVPRVDVKLYTSPALSFRLRARYAGDGYESEDSPYLAGMDERKGSVWAGGAAIWKNDIANVSAELLGDASGNSKGSRFKLQVDHRFGMGSFGITPRLGAEFYDRKYVEYYYGVKASEATATRSAYQGDSSTGVEAGLRVDYSPARQHTVFLDLGVTGYGDAIKDSSLVEKSSQSRVSVGYIYRF